MDADSDDDRERAERQREWADWAARGYRKLYQPWSVRRFGLVLASVLVTVFWFAARGGLP